MSQTTTANADTRPPGPPSNLGQWWRILRRVWVDLDDKNMMLIAAGVAFYSILAVFPAIAAVIAIWGIVADPEVVAVEVDKFRAVLPQEVYDLISQQIAQLVNGDRTTLTWASAVSLTLALWTSRAGVAAVMRGLNAIYGQPNRAGLSHYIRAMLLTLTLVGVALVALACVVLAPIVIRFVPFGIANSGLIELSRWVVMIVVLYAGISLLYRMGPVKREARMKWFTPGAIFATLGWTAASIGFSVYLQNFGNYNEIYGSIGAVIALLMWLFISAFLVLLGGSINAHFERERWQRRAQDPV
ncbi:YihY/virulence factor BrkB family protein [Pseudosulfitobacter pseudonitzschiae]|uniref:YihY/virulence factor BrkB family protein n=1 Tax=Pseudosulfitobacter pseudonitzschiae TaxID=1402135 RepID=UPI001CC9DF7E|nr:YihY/virulence factor BrkB family protein [Pseudosulfitobacter pseudonitzschiae]MCA0135844.1 YihY/virulence factor BrkB family protein [Pseudosulfitobacter pseudonitzschiae]MCD2327192.1 YihY/virulence factor BrkB family protein [Pseudosulfitobacter pseudonitzschiae]MCD2351857.1 YihY/virulence factor BrkB family protein [Pseudosulfitobacter pseudonitzschiae]MCI2213682.1 YihY/virulence factor BrkB family protein [Pseudosulfitobacter pseudonitzschiae]UFE27424.1 YihY/virulence factor BrkB famil